MPTAYREYQPGYCQNCGKDLGVVGQYGGRDRRYCDGACRQQAFRKRQEEKRHLAEARAVAHSLEIYGWKLDDLTLRKIARLGKYGPDAIKEACEIAMFTAKAIREKAEARGVFL